MHGDTHIQHNQQGNGLLRFVVDPYHLCLPASDVAGVIVPPRLTRFPLSNKAVAGVFKYHGVMVTCYDLRIKFSLSPRADSNSGRLLLGWHDNCLLAFWIDEISTIFDSAGFDWQPLPKLFIDSRQVFDGCYLDNQNIILATSVAQLYNLDRLTSHAGMQRIGLTQDPEQLPLNDQVLLSNLHDADKLGTEKNIPFLIDANGVDVHNSESNSKVIKVLAQVREKSTSSGNAMSSSVNAALETLENKVDATQASVVSSAAVLDQAVAIPDQATSVKQDAAHGQENSHRWQTSAPRVMASDDSHVLHSDGDESVSKQPDYTSPAPIEQLLITNIHDDREPHVETVAGVAAASDAEHIDAPIPSLLTPTATGALGKLGLLLMVITLSGYLYIQLWPLIASRFSDSISRSNLDSTALSVTGAGAIRVGNETDADDSESASQQSLVQLSESNGVISSVVESGVVDDRQVVIRFQEDNLLMHIERRVTDQMENMISRHSTNLANQQGGVSELTENSLINLSVADADGLSLPALPRNSASLTHSDGVLVSVTSVPIKAATIQSGQVAAAQVSRHVVVKGDTLWGIAKRYLGDPYRYPQLARLSRIPDPDLIYPGDWVTIIVSDDLLSN